MHLAEGTLPLTHALAWTAVAAPALAWSVRAELRAQREDPSSRLLMAGATSLLFAVTLLPLPVPVVGATSHICLTPFLALLVGVRRVVWPTFFVLLLQALFFAHGGLTTLGVNTVTLGLVGPVVAVGTLSLLRRIGLRGPLGVALTCGLAGIFVYLADALVLAAALADAAPPWATFWTVVLGFAPVQVPLAVLEAAVSATMVRTLAVRRPELLSPSLRAAAAGALPALLVLVAAMGVFGATGCAYEGIDGSVFGAVAESGGRAPTDSLADLSQGELGLAMTIVVLFTLGFVAGRVWERLLGGRGALPR
jgi:cobalt/nickel transport system permease protein